MNEHNSKEKHVDICYCVDEPNQDPKMHRKRVIMQFKYTYLQTAVWDNRAQFIEAATWVQKGMLACPHKINEALFECFSN